MTDDFWPVILRIWISKGKKFSISKKSDLQTFSRLNNEWKEIVGNTIVGEDMDSWLEWKWVFVVIIEWCSLSLSLSLSLFLTHSLSHTHYLSFLSPRSLSLSPLSLFLSHSTNSLPLSHTLSLSSLSLLSLLFDVKCPWTMFTLLFVCDELSDIWVPKER